MLIQKLSTSAPISHQYLYDHIINTLGWFSGGDTSNSPFQITFSDVKERRIQQTSEDQFTIFIDNNIYHRIINRLSCRDTQSPDYEPEPILRPEVDLILNDYQREILNLCLKHKIPFLFKMPWPSGLSFALVISHDIDLTRKYGLKTLVKDIFTAKFSKFVQHYSQSIYHNNVYWNFDEVMDFYNEKKMISTFFFIARGWEDFSYRYNINSPKFRDLFKKIKNNHHEVGLHSSRYAFDQPMRIKKEIRKLEKTSGEPINGIRQHYLRLKFPQAWQNFQNAGLLYDSSGGYNQAMGFRAGTSFPFRTYDQIKGEILNLFEIPFTVMDYPWLERQQYSNEGVDEFIKISNLIQKCNGLLHILWHPHNLAENEFRPLWDKISDWLDQNKYYNDSLKGLLSWWQKRAGVTLKQLVINTGSLNFILESPDQIKDLCLQIISPLPLELSPNLTRVKPDNELLYELRIGELKQGIQNYQLPFA